MANSLTNDFGSLNQTVERCFEWAVMDISIDTNDDWVKIKNEWRPDSVLLEAKAFVSVAEAGATTSGLTVRRQNAADAPAILAQSAANDLGSVGIKDVPVQNVASVFAEGYWLEVGGDVAGGPVTTAAVVRLALLMGRLAY